MDLYWEGHHCMPLSCLPLPPPLILPQEPTTAVPDIPVASTALQKSRPKGGSNPVPEIRRRLYVQRPFDVCGIDKESERINSRQRKQQDGIGFFIVISVFVSFIVSAAIIVCNFCLRRRCRGQSWIVKLLLSVCHKLLFYFKQSIISHYFRILQYHWSIWH